MDRQTVRQQTGSDVPHRSGTARRSQPRSGRTRRTAAKAASQLQAVRPSPAARQHRRRPRSGLLWIFGLWAVSLVLATLAARSLLDPTVASSDSTAAPAESSPIADASPTAIVPSPTPVMPAPALPDAALDDSYFYQQPETGHLPIVALGSIALSCAMSCILVSRALQPRRSPPRLQHSGKPAAHSATETAGQSAAKQLPAAIAPQMPPIPSGRTAEQLPGLKETAASAIVTVLDADQSLPLDWEEPSLADSLDLRRR